MLALMACCFSPLLTSGQTLGFDEAVKEMLEKNFDIRVVKNNREVAATLNNSANAGLLPSLDGSVAYERSVTNTEQEFLDGRTDQQDNAERNDLSAALLLNWTVFDGFNMFAEKEILESNEQLGAYYLRAASEEAILMLATLYYQVVQQEKAMEVSRQALQISRERYRLAAKMESVGSGSMQQVTQALIDLNVDSSMFLNQQTAAANLKTEMNLMLARDIMAAVEVDSVIPIDSSLQLSEMLRGTASAHVELLIARENTRVATQQIRQARSDFYPEVGVYAGYRYGSSTSEVGFLRSNRNHGPAMGFVINFNLFNGLKDYKNVRARVLQRENTLIAAEKADETNAAATLRAYRNYALGLELMELERQNVARANDNIAIALRKFELGSINSVEFREIQLQLIEARNRLLEAEYTARVHEIELRKQAGTLLVDKY